MKKLIITIASAIALTVLFAGCTNNNDFSNMFGLMGSSSKSADVVAADQGKALTDVQAEAQKMDAPALQKEIDAYTAAISDKTAELDKYQTQLQEMPLSQMMSDKAVTLKDNIAKATSSLDDLNKKLGVFVDQLKAIQK